MPFDGELAPPHSNESLLLDFFIFKSLSWLFFWMPLQSKGKFCVIVCVCVHAHAHTRMHVCAKTSNNIAIPIL